MEVQERANTGRVYSLSSGPSIPEWLGERARRNLSKRDIKIRRRIELLQDLSMPVASTRLAASPNGKYLLAAGTYAPRIRCYELEELGMKFERYVDGDVTDMTFLSEDYGKFVLLRSDRTIDFHAPYGYHTSIRLPTFGRALAYEPTTCELLVAAGGNKGRNVSGSSGGEVYRINLDEGRFATPYAYNSSADEAVGGNCIAVSPSHALTALGCEDGLVRFWDNRLPYNDTSNLSPLVSLDVTSATSSSLDKNENVISNLFGNQQNQVTSLAFDSSGMKIVAGTSNGCVSLYDMRSSQPLFTKEHRYGLPIHTVQFHKGRGSGNLSILSGDSKVVQIWRAESSSSFSSSPETEGSNKFSLGSTISTIEAEADMTHFLTIGDASDPQGQSSGLILCAGEQQKIQSYYSPALGPAPKWCSHLDNITEELEEKDIKRRRRGTRSSDVDGYLEENEVAENEEDGVYDDYKFVTRSEVESLGMQKLVGTPLLRGYMHGFFVDASLYSRVKAVANPFEYDDYRKKKLREKLEAKRASRIAPKSASTKKKKDAAPKALVNTDFATRLEGRKGAQSKSGKIAKKMLEDSRFGDLFTNKDFEIDEDDFQFKLRNPSGVAKPKEGDDDDEDEPKRDNRGEDMDSDQEDDDGSDGEVEGFSKVNVEEEEEGWGNERGDGDDSDESYDSDDDEDGIRGGKVRGENYKQIKALEKQAKKIKQKELKQKKKIRKERSKKNVMYEADEYADDAEGNAAALGIGLGDVVASTRAKKMKEEMSMTLGERLEQRKKKQKLESIIAGDDGEGGGAEYALPGGGAMTKMKKGVGGSMKEVSYIPRDVRKKMEKGNDNDDEGGRGRGRNSDGRKRRGVKDLGFKTPFKNQT